jgi:hypothetical protein
MLRYASVIADRKPFAIIDGKVNTHAETFLMRDKQSYALNPHMDSFSKVISALFYLPPDNSAPQLGTSLYAPKQKDMTIERGNHTSPENFELLHTAPYRANTMLAFPNVLGSFHGVEPVNVPGYSRDVMLYDIKFTGVSTALDKSAMLT